MIKLVHKEKHDWRGIRHDLELYESDSVEGLDQITQVQAVPFVDQDHVVLYKHVEGHFGLPGGHPEEGESFEAALKREVKEECACDILNYGLIGYVKDIQADPSEKVKYQLRYWAKVKLKDEPVNDPCGAAVSREVVAVDEVAAKLNWGKMGKTLVELAADKFRRTFA